METDLISGYLLKGHSAGVTSIVFHPTELILASGSQDQTVRLWYLEQQKSHILTREAAAIADLTFIPEQNILAILSQDNLLKLWSLDTRQLISSCRIEGTSIRAIAFHPQAELMAISNNYQTIQIWSLKTTKRLYTIEVHQTQTVSLAFSPNGKILASGSEENDHNLRLWRVEDKKCNILRGHPEEFSGVSSLAFSPNSRLLASGGKDQKIKLWQLEREEPILSIDAHDGTVNRLAFSPDGLILASASQDTTVKLWDINTGKLIFSLPHQQPVLGVVFSPDNRLLATAGDDHQVRVYTLNYNHLPSGQLSTYQTQNSSTIDYCQLIELLSRQQWREADQETAKKILEIFGKSPQEKPKIEDLTNLPLQELKTIDNLWREYSQDKFGFSVQQKLWLELGGTRGKFDNRIYDQWGEQVGWRVKGNWKNYHDLNFSINAPVGHFPAITVFWSGWGAGWCGTETITLITQAGE